MSMSPDRDVRVIRLERALARERTLRAELEALVENRTRELYLALEEVQRRAGQEHIERLTTLGGIAAGIAHEINNALNFVRGNVQHLERYTRAYDQALEAYREAVAIDPEKAKLLSAKEASLRIPLIQKDLPKLLGAVSTGVNRATTIVRDLGVFSRSESSDEAIVTFHEPLEIAMTLAASRLKRRRVVHDGASEPPLVVGNAGRISQILLNLLLNASDATEPDTGEIHTGFIVDPDKVTMYVRDNGAGIPDHVGARIFDPFFTTKEPGKGTGMGLFVSLKIAREHGGDLSFSSKPGEGTTFRLSLPRASRERDPGAVGAHP